jgi:hypothetical protein
MQGELLFLYISPFHIRYCKQFLILPADILLYGRTLLSEQLNLINLYGPNEDDSKFFNDLDPVKDRTLGSNYSHTQSRKPTEHFMKDLNLFGEK